MTRNPLDNLISDFARFYILMFLYEKPHHGYSIITQFKLRLGKSITPSLVYPFLTLLEREHRLK